MNMPGSDSAPLIAHLAELKTRLIRALVVWALATGLCYYFAADIYRFLIQPLAAAFGPQSGRRLIATGLTETFVSYLRIAMYSGFALGFPLIAAQLYQFIAPGLYKNERRALVPYLVAAPLLFLAGSGFAYYCVMPKAWQFFVSFEIPSGAGALPLVIEAKVSEYLALVLHIVLAFGLAFQLPVLLLVLIRAGLLRVAALKRGRRYAVVILLTVAAFITPPDILSQLLLFIPLYALYELAILLGAGMEKRRADTLIDEEYTHA